MIVDHGAHIEIKAENDPVNDRGFVKVTVQVHTVMTVTEFERFRAKPSVLRLDPARSKVQVEI